MSSTAAIDQGHAHRAGTPVWLWRSGCWRPGVVLHATATAVTVRYRPASGGGSAVDTATADQVTPRSDGDSLLDHALGW